MLKEYFCGSVCLNRIYLYLPMCMGIVVEGGFALQHQFLSLGCMIWFLFPLWYETLLNHVQFFLTSVRDDEGLYSIKIKSSANKLILCLCGSMLIPVILLLDLICSAKGSITKLKIKGEKGHHCLVPFVIWNGVERWLDVYTRAESLVYRASMALEIRPSNSNYFITRER